MNLNHFHILTAAILCVYTFPLEHGSAAEPTAREADVVIYGGTSAGVMAAVQVRRMGKSCVLIEPGHHLGGLSSSGLGRTDADDTRVIGGLAREFYKRLKQHYDRDESWIYEDRQRYKAYKADADGMFYFEPHVAEKLFDQFAKESGAMVVRGERLDLKSGVVMQGRRITALRTESGKTFKGAMFIDASYEGDLLPGAGVRYTIGREANSLYNETLNGVQAALAHHHQLGDGIDPWNKPGDPNSGLLPGIGPKPGPDGSGDKRVQAYNFRMCLTDVPENRIPFTKPVGYDEARYELLFRNFAAGQTGVPLFPTMMPNRKTDTNNRGGFSTDFIGANYAYPEAGYAEREHIIKEHEIYQKGLMWTLANHPRVPTGRYLCPQRRKSLMLCTGFAGKEFMMEITKRDVVAGSARKACSWLLPLALVATALMAGCQWSQKKNSIPQQETGEREMAQNPVPPPPEIAPAAFERTEKEGPDVSQTGNSADQPVKKKQSFAESFLFQPVKYPKGFEGLIVEGQRVEFKSEDGTELDGRYFRGVNPKQVVVFFHGNGGNLGFRASRMAEIQKRHQVAVFLFDYRGYLSQHLNL